MLLLHCFSCAQVAFEGQISRSVSLNALAKGTQYHGDLIPWTVSQHFQDTEFPKLSGARVVRIATHPEITGGGYGSKAIELLKLYFEGGMQGLGGGYNGEDKGTDPKTGNGRRGTEGEAAAGGESKLLTETIAPKRGLPPLLISLEERAPENLQYLGVAFGLTPELFNFWKKNDYHPVYIRHGASDTTGEHSCICVHPLDTSDIENGDWLAPFCDDFKTRFVSLLGRTFDHLDTSLALAIVDPFIDFTEAQTKAAIEEGLDMRKLNGQKMSPFDLKRLESFTSNLSDYSLVKDLVPGIVAAYFSKHVPVQLSSGQAAILLGTGLQQKTEESLGASLNLPGNQVRALANKGLKKIYAALKGSKEKRIDRALPVPKRDAGRGLVPHKVTVDEDLREAEAEADDYMKSALSLDKVSQFAISAEDVDLRGAMNGSKGAVPESGTVSVKSKKPKEADAEALYKRKKRKKSDGGKKSKSKPKKR